MKYRKRPVVVEAMQWNGNNLMEIVSFMRGLSQIGFRKSLDASSVEFQKWCDYEAIVARDGLTINTLEGKMKASIGDYIIKGINGEFYPCKPDIFEKTYEKVDQCCEKAKNQEHKKRSKQL